MALGLRVTHCVPWLGLLLACSSEQSSEPQSDRSNEPRVASAEATDPGVGQAGNQASSAGGAASGVDENNATAASGGGSGGSEAPVASDMGGASPGVTLTVSAGELSRERSIVTFQLPEGVAARAVVDAQGQAFPLQVDQNGSATFILPALAAGSEATLSLSDTPPPETGAINATEAADGVSFTLTQPMLDDQPVFRFITQGQLPQGVDEVYLRGGYIHPLLSPSGARVTGDYDPGHAHHHGIWSAWRLATFDGRETDFWNLADRKGRVDFRELHQVYSGPVVAGLTAGLVQIDLTSGEPVDVLDELWELRAYRTHEADGPYFLIDLVSTQETASGLPLRLEEYLYGGFGVRGREDWDDSTNITFLTSEGHGRIAGEDTPGRWCYIGGEVDGGMAGLALLGHPDNFRSPQKLRIHPEMPYYSYAPAKDGPFTIEPGVPYVTKFRIVSLDGPPDAALLDRLYSDYAAPPEVSVQPTR